jgi:hypothetical protein
MADDTQWRVRLSVVETLPVYARHLGMEMFDERLKDIQCRALSDSVAHIRERAILNLAELSKEFGDEWMKASILPSVQEAAKGTGPASYLGRITSLQAVSALAATMPGVIISEVLVQQVCVPLARDRVVNVRIAAAEALNKCADKLQGENPNFVKDCIRPVSPYSCPLLPCFVYVTQRGFSVLSWARKVYWYRVEVYLPLQFGALECQTVQRANYIRGPFHPLLDAVSSF